MWYQQPGLNYNRRVYTTQIRNTPEQPSQVNRETVPLDPTGQLLLAKGQSTGPGYIAVLPNTQKQTQGGCQNEGAKKHVPDERTEQNSRKRNRQNGDKQSGKCRVQNTSYKDAQ